MFSDEELINGLQMELEDLRPSSQLLEQLRARAHNGDGRRRPWKQLPIKPATAISVTAVIGVAAVVAAFVGLAGHTSSSSPPTGHHHLGGPGPGHPSGPPTFPHLSSPQHQVLDDVMKAESTTDRNDPGCITILHAVHAPSAKPSLSNGTPSTELLSMLGALRRRQAVSDQLPPRKIWHGPHSQPRSYPDGTYPAAQGIYSRYIRKVRSRFGASYFIVPAINVNQDQPQPARCYGQQRAALHHELPHIPRHLQHTAVALQRRYIAYEKRLSVPYPGACLVAINASGNGDGASCFGTSQIKNGHTLTSGGPTGVPVVYGLAPDGVRNVTLIYGNRSPHKMRTVPVINNVFILHNPHQQLAHNGFPDRVLWRSGGQIVKTITSP